MDSIGLNFSMDNEKSMYAIASDINVTRTAVSASIVYFTYLRILVGEKSLRRRWLFTFKVLLECA